MGLVSALEFLFSVAAALGRLRMGQVFAPQAKRPNLKHLYNGQPKGLSWELPKTNSPWAEKVEEGRFSILSPSK